MSWFRCCLRKVVSQFYFFFLSSFVLRLSALFLTCIFREYLSTLSLGFHSLPWSACFHQWLAGAVPCRGCACEVTSSPGVPVGTLGGRVRATWGELAGIGLILPVCGVDWPCKALLVRVWRYWKNHFRWATKRSLGSRRKSALPVQLLLEYIKIIKVI